MPGLISKDLNHHKESHNPLERFTRIGLFVMRDINPKISMKHVHTVNPESGKYITYENKVPDLMYKPTEIVSRV